MSVAHVPAAVTDPLRGVDLNLLLAFDALARERSVTLAAKHLGVTQSAMSHTLRRLRELLGDPLLVRGQGGMAFTPRAEALRVPLRAGLDALGRALVEPDRFEPSSARRVFRIVSPDLFNVLVVPSMLVRVCERAPDVDIAVLPFASRRLAEQLETGEVDLAATARVEGTDDDFAANGLVRRTLFRDRLVCLVRPGHAVLRGKTGAGRKRIPLSAYTALSHAFVSPSGEGGGAVDEALRRLGLGRRIAARVPDVSSAVAIVEKSDLVLTAPTAASRVAAGRLVTFAPPLDLPGHSIDIVWHERFSSDAGHTWLRAIVAESALVEVERIKGSNLRRSR